MFTRAWQREGGYIPVPDAVGIGIEVDYDALEAVDWNPRPLGSPIRVDGSVGFSV